jgi:hypothetical protein
MRLSWTAFKNLTTAKLLKMQYVEGESSPIGTTYFLTAYDHFYEYNCRINDQDNASDISDFETNYKATANEDINPRDTEGKEFIRAESRPLECTTCFTTCGDTDGANPVIGAGSRLAWDASVADGWVDDENGAPAGMKQFSVTIQ